MRALLIAATLSLLGACATATPYQAASSNHYGFQEQQVESNRVRITFRGNTLTDRDTVETYLLYRAAEVTLEHGKDYFIVADRGTDEHTRLESIGPDYPRFPFGYRYFSRRHGWSRWYDPFWEDPTSYREVTRYEAVAEIAMFDGPKPQDNANAFDAREVQANLQGRIVRPPAPAS
jgi:hypothetical protein